MQTGRLPKAEWTYTNRNTARKYRALMSCFTKYPDGDYVTLREISSYITSECVREGGIHWFMFLNILVDKSTKTVMIMCNVFVHKILQSLSE
jgi:hypothetical protein